MIFCTYFLWRMILGIFCQNLFSFRLCIVPTDMDSGNLLPGSFFQPLFDDCQADTSFRRDLLQSFAFLPCSKNTFASCTIIFLFHFDLFPFFAFGCLKVIPYQLNGKANYDNAYCRKVNTIISIMLKISCYSLTTTRTWYILLFKYYIPPSPKQGSN